MELKIKQTNWNFSLCLELAFCLAKEVLLKVLPQIQRRQWWQIEMEITQIMKVISNAILCAPAAQKMRARVTRDGTVCAKNSTFISREPAPLLKKYIQFTVSFPDYGSCRELFQVVSSLLANSLLGRSKRARGTRRDTRPLAAHFARPNRTACSHA